MSAGGEDDREAARDAAAVLPFAAVALIMPPVILVFATPLLFAGIPLVVVYLFGVWALAIGAAAFLARRLAPGHEEEAGDAERDEDRP